jgi:hypothetical protein
VETTAFEHDTHRTEHALGGTVAVRTAHSVQIAGGPADLEDGTAFAALEVVGRHPSSLLAD